MIEGVLDYVAIAFSKAFSVDSVSKSRNIRGRIGSIVTDLRLANEQIAMELQAGETKHLSELEVLEKKIAKLELKIASSKRY